MSHAEYVATRDEEQLISLIEHASARLKAIRESGHVKLWEVSIGWGNVGWFPQDEYEAAVEFACAAVKSEAAHGNKGVEMAVKLERYRPDEAAELVKRRPAGPRIDRDKQCAQGDSK